MSRVRQVRSSQAWGPTIASLPFSIGIRIEGNNGLLIKHPPRNVTVANA